MSARRHAGADGERVRELLDVGGAAVVHGGGVDDHAERAGLAGQPGDRDQVLVGGLAS